MVMEPCHVQLQGPPLSAKVPFVRFDPVDWMLSADKAQTDYRNKILEICICVIDFFTDRRWYKMSCSICSLHDHVRLHGKGGGCGSSS